MMQISSILVVLLLAGVHTILTRKSRVLGFIFPISWAILAIIVLIWHGMRSGGFDFWLFVALLGGYIILEVTRLDGEKNRKERINKQLKKMYAKEKTQK